MNDNPHRKQTGFIFLMMLMMAGVVVACTHRRQEPDHHEVLPDTTMVAVLTDIFLIEGVMIQLEYIRQKEPGSGVPYYEMVYRKYGITRNAFVRSLEWYMEEPERMDNIYDRVIQNLGKMQVELRDETEATAKDE